MMATAIKIPDGRTALSCRRPDGLLRLERGCAIQRRSGGFSLIEIIGVLAIIAILAAATLPALIQEVDYASAAKEYSNLDALASGLQNGASSARYIPLADPVDWPGFLANYLGWETNAVQTNLFSHNSRAFLIDPGLVIGSANPTSAHFQQTALGASPVTSARFIIASSISLPLPPSGSIDFNLLWNTTDKTLPSGAPWDNWQAAGGKGTDLILKRVDLTTSFVRVILNNADAINNASYIIDNNPVSNLAVGAPPFEAFFLAGTVLSLQGAANSVSQVLQQDVSWVFQNGNWHKTKTGPDPYGALQPAVQAFLLDTPNNAMTTATVLQEMLNYMSKYDQYAKSKFLSTKLRGQLQTISQQLSQDLNQIVTAPPPPP